LVGIQGIRWRTTKAKVCLKTEPARHPTRPAPVILFNGIASMPIKSRQGERSNLTDGDYAALERSYISREIADAARLYRVVMVSGSHEGKWDAI